MPLKLTYCFLIFMLLTQVSLAQDPGDIFSDENKVSPEFVDEEQRDSLQKLNKSVFWSQRTKLGVDFHEVAFQNWNAGGTNSISLLFKANLQRTLHSRNIRWKNEFIAEYGISAEKGRKLRKTDDRLEFISTVGYRADTLTNWFYSAKLNFKSQFDNGYDYPNRDEIKSGFMKPGYLFTGVGADYFKESKDLSVYLSPVTLKTTFVLDRRLADNGEFGVKPAKKDAFGNIISHSKGVKSEFGILITNTYTVELSKNIKMDHRITLYTDYLDDFGNVDIDWNLQFAFKVNDFVEASLGSHIIYDDDTKTTRTNAEGEEVKGGAKVQWKQQLGIGLAVSI